MHDRAALLHGDLRVESVGQGTSVVLDIPWEDKK
jgi:nitrate/nitrite-specific signal transduction histidine kinase